MINSDAENILNDDGMRELLREFLERRCQRPIFIPNSLLGVEKFGTLTDEEEKSKIYKIVGESNEFNQFKECLIHIFQRERWHNACIIL